MSGYVWSDCKLHNCLSLGTASEVWGIPCFYLEHWHLLWEADHLGKGMQCCAKQWFCGCRGRRNSDIHDNPTSPLPLLAGGRRFLIPNPKPHSSPSNLCSCERLQSQAGIQSSKKSVSLCNSPYDSAVSTSRASGSCELCAQILVLPGCGQQ